MYHLHLIDPIRWLIRFFFFKVNYKNYKSSSINYWSLEHKPVAFWPIRRSSVAGKQIGAMCGANSNGASSFTNAKSYSYVKKLYFGWTTFFATARSMYGNCSWMWEKSYSPTRIRIWDVSKLKKKKIEELITWKQNKMYAFISTNSYCKTYSSTQWPAVAIQFSLITAPPHRCVLENPKNDVRRTDTCQGHRPNGAFFPPTIRVSGLLTIVGIPQSIYKKQKKNINFITKK